jgi:hypothetical protein
MKKKGIRNAWSKSESVADEKLVKDMDVRAPIETDRDMVTPSSAGSSGGRNPVLPSSETWQRRTFSIASRAIVQVMMIW